MTQKMTSWNLAGFSMGGWAAYGRLRDSDLAKSALGHGASCVSASGSRAVGSATVRAFPQWADFVLAPQEEMARIRNA
jgi:hypothetical protein